MGVAGLATVAATTIVPAAASAEPVTGHAPVYCTSPELLTQDYYDLVFLGDKPATVAPGQSFAIANARLQILIGTKSINVLHNVFKVDRIGGTVVRMDVATTGASPAKIDVASRGPITFGPGTLELGTQAAFDAAIPGGTVGPFTAGGAGLATLSIGHVEIKVHLSSTTDPNLQYDVSLSCDQAVPLPFAQQSVAAPSVPRSPAAAKPTVSAQSTGRVRKLTMKATGLSRRCSASRSRKVRVRVSGARGGVREIVFRLDGRAVRHQEVAGRRVTLRLKSGKRHQRLAVRATDESGRSVTLRRTLCVR